MPDYSKDQQKVKEITDRLEQGLKELFDSEKYKEYLNTMSKFHNYSFNNTLLIALQKPDATLVAGYQAWQKNFDRHVNKGEKGIRILAPAPYKVMEERDKHDPITGEMMFDDNGMPEKEEVEVTIPAFRTVSVFDVSQTDGKPIPELGVSELLASVDGYKDFMEALKSVSTAPIEFADIPGGSHGYFSLEDKKIVVQEGMSESQTLKTTIHEIAHSMLHDRDINAPLDLRAKDRNTKEVEAESIAYTVCQHFGIDTSEYSFSYVAGWSSDKEMRELKSSLDTIRKTASELITGIEREIKVLQQEREAEQEHGKESILLVQDSGLTEYSLLSVRGMNAKELMEALSGMNDDDKLSIAAYLESKGAWTTEIANQDTKEWREYNLDVRYLTDRNEIIDLKAEREMDERAKEPIGVDDVILKITYSNGERFEVERITNKTPEEVHQIMGEINKLSERNRNSIHECFKAAGADFIPIIVSDGRNAGTPQFNDIEFDPDKKNVTMMHHQSPSKQAEGIINRLEYGRTAFSDEQKNLIVNHAFKLSDMEKTKEIAEKIADMKESDPTGVGKIIKDAQTEIDALPDPMIGISEMNDYGYDWEQMLPLTQERALELYDQDLPVYLLHEDGSETMVEGREQLEFYEGICGIEKKDWEHERNIILQNETEVSEDEKVNMESSLLYSNSDKFGIYQLKDNPEFDNLRFESTENLKRMGLATEDLSEIKQENYNLLYVGDMKDLKGTSKEDCLEIIYENFNLRKPEDFKGHSLSVGDVVVIHEKGENTAHFVDSFGFTDIPMFLETEREVYLSMKNATELAYQIADRYLMIHETDGGYDYSIMGPDYKEIDGGVYDNPDVSIHQAIEDIVDDLRTPRYNEQTDTFYHSAEQGNIGANDELIPMDYEMMEEKVEEANRVMPSTVISDFKEKTKELFHEIAKMSPEEVEETIKCHVQAKIDEYDLDATIVDCAIVGTRCRGMEQEESDLDVVVELTTNEREDALFDMFNEDGLHLAGIKVDINPITPQRTGTLETYLPQAEEYLDGVRESRMNEAQKEVEVTLTVAECGEFHNYGEYHEGITSVEEALKIFESIPPDRLHGNPQIGIQVHTVGDDPYQDSQTDVVSRRYFDLDALTYVPDIACNAKAMDMIAELISRMPDTEIRGEISAELQGRIDVYTLEQLANDIDRFTYAVDPYEYRDNVSSREENVEQIKESIETGNGVYIQDWLQTFVTDGNKDDAEQAKELLKRIDDYKPLAKVEELEEQNYNMIDNVLNNGAGEKERDKKEKVEQVERSERPSLKEKLEEKKFEAANHSISTQPKLNDKNADREVL